jgi:hypothetical protein
MRQRHQQPRLHLVVDLVRRQQHHVIAFEQERARGRHRVALERRTWRFVADRREQLIEMNA